MNKRIRKQIHKRMRAGMPLGLEFLTPLRDALSDLDACNTLDRQQVVIDIARDLVKTLVDIKIDILESR